MASGQTVPSSDAQVIFASERDTRQVPDIRILHYNDVYHVDAASAEPVGGLARFITLCREYQEGKPSEGQPKILTLFSGDAFNPSLESSVTKGEMLQRMVQSTGALYVLCTKIVWSLAHLSRTPYGACVERHQNGLCLCRSR